MSGSFFFLIKSNTLDKIQILKKIGTTDRLSFFILAVFYSITFLVGYFKVSGQEQSNEQTLDDSKKLIHIVLIEFKSTVSKTDMQLVVDAAYSLQQIEGVKDLNFGENTSPEGLNKDYTHSLTMKFNTSEDRDSVYLPNQIHQKFVKLFLPLTESVLVYDYWE
jgi:hypothetical protein